MIDLNTFIKVDFIREELKKSCVIVSNIEEADNFAHSILMGEYKNVIFEKSSLKSYCFEKISGICDVNIINCNSCMERFCEDVQNESQITIFDNINDCKNIDILHLVSNKKGILVC